MNNASTAVQLFRNSLDRFLAKDMKGWTSFECCIFFFIQTNLKNLRLIQMSQT